MEARHVQSRETGVASMSMEVKARHVQSGETGVASMSLEVKVVPTGSLCRKVQLQHCWKVVNS